MPHRDGLPRFSPISVGRGDAGHREASATLSESLGKPPFRSPLRSVGGRRKGFDLMAPENVAPLVVWLGSPESREVTGRVFEVSGGAISIADAWREGPRIDKGARWEPDEVGAAVQDLLGKAIPPQRVYGT